MSIPQTSYFRPTNITTKQESCNFYLLNYYRFTHTENRVFTCYYRIVIDLVLSSIKLAKIIWYSGSVCACKMSVKVNRVWVREWIKKIVGIKKIATQVSQSSFATHNLGSTRTSLSHNKDFVTKISPLSTSMPGIISYRS